MSIFVSIACFMDTDILNTIDSCLSKAKFPNNITFGICLQSEHEDQILDKYRENNQFKIIKLHWKDAKGPTYARFLISQLVQKEMYFLQIDAHTRFFDNWDATAIFCLHECKYKKSILTSFPVSIEKMHEQNIPLNISTKKFQFLSYESIKLGSVTCSNNSPVQTYYLSAAFLFGPSRFLEEVPFDPYLTYSYQSVEQQFYATRLFTHGWYLFKPSAHILATFYGKSVHKDLLGNIVRAPYDCFMSQQSWKRVLYYYGLCELCNVEIKQDIEMYGLGNENSLDDFFQIHNQSGCINKIKNGLKYRNGNWSKYNFYSTNKLLRQIVEQNDFFCHSVDNTHFEWNIYTQNYDKLFQHYQMHDVSFIDNKSTFFRLLIENNVTGIPKTYLHIDDIPITKNNQNYFLKYAGNNGGQHVFLFNELEEIAKRIAIDNRAYVIQEEVPKMLLIEKKKFILRMWIVIVGEKFFISMNGCCIIHEFDFNANTLDRKVHIEHDTSKISYIKYNSTSFYTQSMSKIRILSKNVCQLIKPKLAFRKNCYQVLGIDVILDNQLNPYIIEFNSWPNMSVPYENYKGILEEFFTHFLNDIAIKKLNNEEITDTAYFSELEMG